MTAPTIITRYRTAGVWVIVDWRTAADVGRYRTLLEAETAAIAYAIEREAA